MPRSLNQRLGVSLPDGTAVVPYRMAMNLRLSEAETQALRRKADEEGRSMQEVARTAIAAYVSERPARLREAIDRVRREDAELLDRLAR
jgi:predicted transcriptional regulator